MRFHLCRQRSSKPKPPSWCCSYQPQHLKNMLPLCKNAVSCHCWRFEQCSLSSLTFNGKEVSHTVWVGIQSRYFCTWRNKTKQPHSHSVISAVRDPPFSLSAAQIHHQRRAYKGKQMKDKKQMTFIKLSFSDDWHLDKPQTRLSW